MKFEEICCNALIQWGAESQIKMAIEECAELIQALCHMDRLERCNLDNVAEEVADVEIMCGQLRVLLGNDKVNRFREEKLKRLKDRIRGIER